MNAPATESAAVRTYLDRLRDALPPARADEVVREVAALIADRVEGDGDGAPDDPQAVAKALQALGPPDALATAIAGGGLTIPAATRRAFARVLAVVFGAHLLLAIVMAVVGSDVAILPGIVGALPRASWLATVLGVVGVLLTDVGVVFLLFLVIGRERAPVLLPHLPLRMEGTRRDAALSMILLLLVALLLDVPTLRDRVFAIGSVEGRVPILAQPALDLLPFANVLLGFLLLRHGALLASGRERRTGVLLDALASLAGVLLCVEIVRVDDVVAIPATASLTAAQAAVFSDLLRRVVLVVAVLSGLLLVARFARRALRLRELLGARGA